MLGASQEQARWDHMMGIVVNLQKRVYELERQVRTMKVVRKKQ